MRELCSREGGYDRSIFFSRSRAAYFEVGVDVSEPAKGVAAKTKEKLEVKFRKGFSRYVEENFARYSTVKTIISTSTPIPLGSIYVNLFLKHPNRVLRDEDFLNLSGNYRSVLFTATAGSGKSMLMRYLFLKFLQTQTDRLPVFIELRELNQQPAINLQAFVRAKLSDYIDGFSEAQLKYAFETGRVILFLDGFDEIDYDKRKERERQINELAARYPNLWMFVSSRPAETFASWEKFFVFSVQPFTRKQVELLISNISYDEEIKNIFRKKLEEGLYDSHKEFLTNPLLTIMMLITLAQFAEVPAKIHLFYEYAFEALFGRHDVTKGGFQRKRHTNLALDDFKRLFSYFCMITYLDEAFSFSSDVLLEKIQQSIASSQIEVDKINFRNDLTESCCMLVMDGLDYTFSHRSFQEYFSAYFLARVKTDEFERVLPKLVQRSSFDSVMSMVSEMNKEKFEESWALPTLEKLCSRVAGVDAEKSCIGFISKLIGGSFVLHVRADTNDPDVFGITVTTREAKNHPREAEAENWGNIRHALYRSFDVFNRINAALKGVVVKDSEILSRIRSGELLNDDSRFKKLRSRKPRDEEAFGEILLRESDSKWLHETHIGKFIELESRVLVQLRDEVRRRVEARKKGLANIFPRS